MAGGHVTGAQRAQARRDHAALLDGVGAAGTEATPLAGVDDARRLARVARRSRRLWRAWVGNRR